MDNNLFADEIRKREEERRRKEPLWGLLSFLLHGALFVVVVLCTPVKQLILPEPKEKANPAADLSADRIEDIGESLSEVRMNELLQQIQAMQDVLHNMDVMKEELAKDYDKFAEKTAQDVRTELENLVKETAEAQQKSSEAQAVVKQAVQEIVAIEMKADLADRQTSKDLHEKADKLMYETVEKTNTAQANAVNALDKLQVKAEFAGFKKTAEAAEKFRDAQIEAAKLQDETQTASIQTAQELVAVAGNEKRLDEVKKTIEESKAKVESAEQVKVEADKRIAAEEKEMKAAEQKRDRLRQEKKWEEVKQAQQVASEHRRAMDQAKRESQNAQRQMNEAKSRQARAEKKLPELLKKQAELAKVKETRATEAQIKDLEKAESAQKRLNKEIETLKAVLASDSAELKKLAQEENRQENRLVDEQAAQLSMSKAYELAKQLESAIAESYKDIKATETAISKKMSFEAAQKITDVAKPERLVADAAALESKPRTKEALDKQKQAQTEVVREADNMVEATVAMMNEAMEIVMGKDSSAQMGTKEKSNAVKRLEEKDLADRSSEEAMAERMAAMEAEAEYQLKLENAAVEDSNEKAKDLSELMAEDNAKAGENGSLTGANPGPPELKGGDLALLPGNVMSIGPDAKDAIPAKWMYVNSWHVIGPFPNPNRVNLRRKFAPESKVDLDATYIGKDGRVLKWEFCQAKNAKPPQPWMADWRAEVIPEKKEEYSIYYAYAEVFFDRDCDRWVAIGSDDRSDVWLNDVPIWGSSNKLKAWTLAEDFRRVHFKKGRNRILARVENGHWNCGWSLCISVEDAKTGL
ncbi:MAG: hypothetical protein SOW92_08595 [Kiritimatiellia bacterium]|nr:hypothetical protein [Kiritimatiellia bacterium]